MSQAEIQRLLDDRDLEVLPAEPGEAVEYWRKAVRACADSRMDEARLRRQLSAMQELLDRLPPAVREWLVAQHPDVGDLPPAR